jgi:dienelactone hydrolase
MMQARAWFSDARWLILGSVLGLAALAVQAQPVDVQLPSLDAPGGTPVVLKGHWFAAPGTAAAPAMVLMHGCGGAYDRRGRLGDRYTGMAARLNAMGVHVLVTDSFGPRQEKEICTQRTGQRRIDQSHRRRDALGALQWLAARAEVDASRLGLLGWSNGGSTVLAALNLRHREVAAAPVRPSLAVAFYPGCEAELGRGFEPSATLLMQLGEADDWTPAAPCKALAAAVSKGPIPQWDAYAGAHHGFDGTAPLRHRADVPNGVHPGQGVHVGAHPVARAAAAVRVDTFIRETWRLKP